MVSFPLRICLVSALVAACGADPLGHVGEGSSEWIGAPTVTTAELSTVNGPSLAAVAAEDWYNSDLAPVAGATAAEIISAVYARAKPADAYVQATPEEIALALPGVVFPALLPPEVRYITSQLVYDLTRVTLASDQVAAFGLWTVEPYTRSRSVGQQGVLTVVPDAEGLAAFASGTADTSCSRFIDREAECSVRQVGDRPAWELTDPLGTTLVWYGEAYRYELFLRQGVNAALAVDMAESAKPLAALAR
jgi:hypothetical protein